MMTMFDMDDDDDDDDVLMMMVLMMIDDNDVLKKMMVSTFIVEVAGMVVSPHQHIKHYYNNDMYTQMYYIHTFYMDMDSLIKNKYKNLQKFCNL